MTINRFRSITGLLLALLLTAGCDSQTSGNGRGTDSVGSSTGSTRPTTDSVTATTDAGSDGGRSDNGTAEAGTTDAAGTADAGTTADGTTNAGTADAAATDGGGPVSPNGTANLKPPAKFPETKLSETHKKWFLLSQGDTMPDFELEDLEGNTQQLSASLGDQLTVVFFWPGEGRIAQREAPQHLADLQIDVANVFADRGVKIVGINYKQPLETVKNIAGTANVSFPILLDESGDAFAQLGTEGLPRTYLIDAERRILWFDLYFSFDTMRGLKQAIAFVLSNDAADALEP